MKGLVLWGALGLAVLLPLATLAQTAASTTSTSTNIASTASNTPAAPRTNAGVEQIVRAYFADIPVMIEVARCESKFRQYADSGNVLHGGYGSSMIGVFQFSESVHRSGALARGFDIDTPEGNVAYARYLYDQSGTDPWISSFSCWNTGGPERSTTNTPTAPKSDTNTNSSQSNTNNGALTKDLNFGMVDPQVLVLQQLLNKAGYTIATQGPGSPGNETSKFGDLTRAAVRRFQCEKSVSCSGDEYTTGYGFVGERTRNILLAAPQVKGSSTSNSSSNTSKPSSASSNSSSKNVAQVAELQAQIAIYQGAIDALRAQIKTLER